MEEDIKIKHPKKLAFLENYPKFLFATKTAEAIGIDESTHYEWLNGDKAYSQAFQEIKKKIYAKRLEENEAEIHRRGLNKSDLLLIFETKALAPERYREKPPETRLIGDITVKLSVPPYTDHPVLPPEAAPKQLKEGKEDAI